MSNRNHDRHNNPANYNLGSTQYRPNISDRYEGTDSSPDQGYSQDSGQGFGQGYGQNQSQGQYTGSSQNRSQIDRFENEGGAQRNRQSEYSDRSSSTDGVQRGFDSSVWDGGFSQGSRSGQQGRGQSAGRNPSGQQGGYAETNQSDYRGQNDYRSNDQYNSRGTPGAYQSPFQGGSQYGNQGGSYSGQPGNQGGSYSGQSGGQQYGDSSRGSYGQNQYGSQSGNQYGQSGHYGQSGQSGQSGGYAGNSSSSGSSSFGNSGGRGGNGSSMQNSSVWNSMTGSDQYRSGADGARKGSAPKNYKKSDDRISDDLCEKLMHQGLDCSGVEVSVKEGIVTLTGEVCERNDKHRIEQIAADISGVNDVENQLRMAKKSNGSTSSATFSSPKDTSSDTASKDKEKDGYPSTSSSHGMATAGSNSTPSKDSWQSSASKK